MRARKCKRLLLRGVVVSRSMPRPERPATYQTDVGETASCGVSWIVDGDLDHGGPVVGLCHARCRHSVVVDADLRTGFTGRAAHHLGVRTENLHVLRSVSASKRRSPMRRVDTFGRSSCVGR